MRLVKPSSALGAIATMGSSSPSCSKSPLSSSMGASSQRWRTRRPAAPDFSGWNWQPRMLPRRTDETKTSLPYCVVVWAQRESAGVALLYRTAYEWTK